MYPKRFFDDMVVERLMQPIKPKEPSESSSKFEHFGAKLKLQPIMT
jgi:hypothetical protein